MNTIENYIKENFGEVRCFKDDNDIIWFVAGDIAKILNYASTQKVTEKIEEEDILRLAKSKVTNLVNFNNNVGKDVIFINESALYDVTSSITKKDINRYNKAREFKKWITHEVLPNIRRTGGFIENLREEEFVNNYFPELSEETKRAMYLDIMKKNTELKKKADFFDNYLDKNATYTFLQAAKLLSEKLVSENKKPISNIKLTRLLRDKGILSKDKKGKGYSNLPNKDYVQYFKVVDNSYKADDGSETISKTQTRVKAEGIEFIYSLL